MGHTLHKRLSPLAVLALPSLSRLLRKKEGMPNPAWRTMRGFSKMNQCTVRQMGTGHPILLGGAMGAKAQGGRNAQWRGGGRDS